MKRIVIGSRDSALAVRQTELVMEQIRRLNPDMELELVTMKTTGDKILHKTLDKIGGKGLFVKELDQALSEGRIDLAVHSLKDMPMEENPDLPIAAMIKRGDPRDVLVFPAHGDPGRWIQKVGSSSLRRQLQLRKLYPEAGVASIRGNILTRLSKLDAGEYSALVLAGAGLVRVGLEERIQRYFSIEEMLPAAGQGILAVQSRKDMELAFLKKADDYETRACGLAERSFVRALNGGCSSPVAAYATLSGQELRLRGLYYRESTEEFWIESAAGSAEAPEDLGRRLAEQMIKQYEE